MKLQYNLTTKYLTHEEEISLFQNYISNNCLKSVQTLILSNLNYVAKLAHEMSNNKVDKNDLFQEGTIGLMKAIKNYNLSFGVRLISYATPYIKDSMMQYIINNLSIVKKITSKSHRKLFFNLNKLRGNIDTLGQDDIRRIANTLNVSEFDVVDVDNRLNTLELDIDSSYTSDSKYSFHDILKSSNDYSYITLKDEDEKLEAINEALRTLNEREKYIFLSRNLTDNIIGLKELSAELNISMERVNQVNTKAFKKVQKYVLTKFES